MTDLLQAPSPEAVTATPARGRRIRIEPPRGWAPLQFGELWAFRDLFLLWSLRDVRLRYKQTVLGIVWVILQPLVASLIFALIFGRFAGIPSDGDAPYLLFVFAGLLPWNLFAGALQRAGSSLLMDSRLVAKVYFPRMIIPLASASAVIIDFLVAFTVMIVLLIAYGWGFRWSLLALPLLTALVLLLSIAISLFISALNVYYRDFTYVLPFVIQVWMYASPVVYSTTIVPPAFQLLYAFNPMVGVIDGFRWALLGGDFPLLSLLISVIAAVIGFIGAALIFQRVEQSFADAI